MTEARNLIAFVLLIAAGFVYICRAIPQIKSESVARAAPIGDSAEAIVAAGQALFMSDRAQCLTCHTIGEDPKARCPNQEGLGARASQQRPGMSAAAYLVQSLYNPNAFIVSGYPRNQMRPVNKPPIALTHDEILAVIAYLNTLGSETDEAFIAQLRQAQDPWRQGLLTAEEAAEVFRVPVYPGDVARGREAFEKQGCIQCHRVGTEGREVGPDLTTIGAAQSPEYILDSILDPSAVIVKGYKQTIVYWKARSRLPVEGTPMAWIPDKEHPRSLRLSVQEPLGIVEMEIDLSEVAYVGDMRVGIETDGEFESLCGEYVAGDAETGLTLKLLGDEGWVERRVASEGIDFVSLPMSPMPSNIAEMVTPREVYDLVTYLVAQKGKK